MDLLCFAKKTRAQFGTFMTDHPACVVAMDAPTKLHRGYDTQLTVPVVCFSA